MPRTRVVIALLAFVAALGSPMVAASRESAPRSSSSTSATEVQDAKARRALEEILARNEFQRARTDQLRQNLLAKGWGAFQAFWARMLGTRVQSRSVATATAWAAPALAAIALIIWSVRRRRPPAERPGLASVTPPPTPSRELLDLAVRCFAEGREREAIRAAYRAAIQRLAEEGAWRVDDTRTPREYLGLLPTGHERRRAVARLTDAFERGWYGSQPGAADNRSAQAWAEMTVVLRDSGWLRNDHAI
jgi:hypothetical protein